MSKFCMHSWSDGNSHDCYKDTGHVGEHKCSCGCCTPSSVPLPILRTYTSAERKAAPVHAGVLLYFPDAIAAIARLSKRGNDKHNPGEPLHWAREKSADHGECAVRHLLTPDVVDEETGEIELVAAAWRVLAMLQLREEKRLSGAGIMPLSGITP